MHAVRKSDRLDRLITHARVLGREIIGDTADHGRPHQQRANNDLARQLVSPLWKNIRHLSASLSSSNPLPKLNWRRFLLPEALSSTVFVFGRKKRH